MGRCKKGREEVVSYRVQMERRNMGGVKREKDNKILINIKYLKNSITAAHL